MKLRLAALLCAACATTSNTRTIDKPTTQLPEGLTKCTAAPDQPIADGAPEKCADDDTLCKETAVIASECLATLKGEVTGTFRGALVLGLNGDDSGNITGVCFYGGTLGEVPQTLGCLAEKARAKRFNIVPDASEQKWTVRYLVE